MRFRKTLAVFGALSLIFPTLLSAQSSRDLNQVKGFDDSRLWVKGGQIYDRTTDYKRPKDPARLWVQNPKKYIYDRTKAYKKPVSSPGIKKKETDQSATKTGAPAEKTDQSSKSVNVSEDQKKLRDWSNMNYEFLIKSKNFMLHVNKDQYKEKVRYRPLSYILAIGKPAESNLYPKTVSLQNQDVPFMTIDFKNLNRKENINIDKAIVMVSDDDFKKFMAEFDKANFDKADFPDGLEISFDATSNNWEFNYASQSNINAQDYIFLK